MTIEQTVDISADRRLHLDFEIPFEVRAGKARVSVTPAEETPKTSIPLLSLRGSCKGRDTMEAYFERKRTEKTLESRNERQKTGIG